MSASARETRSAPVHESVPSPSPFLQLTDFLDPSEHRALLKCVEAQAGRLPAGPPRQVVSRGLTDDGPAIDLGRSWSALNSRLRALVGHLRRELGVDYFVLAGVDGRVTVHDWSSVRGCDAVDEVPVGTRQIDFVYTFQPSDGTFSGGALRLYDTAEVDGVARAAETFTELEALDNAIVFFPSDRHHDVTRVVAAGDGRAVRYAISGSFLGDPLRFEPPTVDVEVARVLQHRYLPAFAEVGFEVRPTPAPVQQLLESLLVLRAGTRRSEDADPRFHTEGSPDLVDVSDLGADLLRWLKPLHQEFAGVPLVAENVFGLRIYGEGNTLEMHVDRPATHVVSSVLQVAQDVDEPWPLMIERDGRVHEIYLDPGQMLLYEGATSDHGRPTPLRGQSFVNLFAHYRPVWWPWTVETLASQAWRDGVIDFTGRLTELGHGGSDG